MVNNEDNIGNNEEDIFINNDDFCDKENSGQDEE